MKMELKWLAWEITRRCNFHCVHCRSSSDDGPANQVQFSFAEAQRFLDDLGQLGKPVVVLSGGEPLLHPDVFQIAQYGDKQGFRMCLATNGSLITDGMCRLIKAAQIKMVSLSLDGASAEVHDGFRGQVGAFESVIRAATYFRENDIPFIINSSFTKRNQLDIVNCFRLSKALGAYAWYLFMVIPTGRGEALLEELIAPSDYQEILDWHYQIEKSEDSILLRPTCAPHYYRVRFQHNRKNHDPHKPRSLSFSPGGSKGCLAGQTIAMVTATGELQACSYLPISAGNVKQKPIRDIWEKSELLQNLRNFATYKGRCGQCEFIKICGGCRARAYMMKGDYLAEEPFCTYQPLRRLYEAKL